MVQWYQVLNIAQTINLPNEADSLSWKLDSSGAYTVSSLYVVLNFRGVMPVNIHEVWKINIPPKMQIFL
jgi:hypothetical protein